MHGWIKNKISPGRVTLVISDILKWERGKQNIDQKFPYTWNKNLYSDGRWVIFKKMKTSFSENNLNIKWYERKVHILKQAQW